MKGNLAVAKKKTNKKKAAPKAVAKSAPKAKSGTTKKGKAPVVTTLVAGGSAVVDNLTVRIFDDGMGMLAADVTCDVILGPNEEHDGDPRLIVTNTATGGVLLDVAMDSAGGNAWEKLGILPGVLIAGTTYKFQVVAKYIVKTPGSTNSSVIRTA